MRPKEVAQEDRQAGIHLDKVGFFEKPGLQTLDDIPQSQDSHELVFFVKDQHRPGLEAAFELDGGFPDDGHGLAQGEPVWDVGIVFQGDHEILDFFLVRHGIPPALQFVTLFTITFFPL